MEIGIDSFASAMEAHGKVVAANRGKVLTECLSGLSSLIGQDLMCLELASITEKNFLTRLLPSFWQPQPHAQNVFGSRVPSPY